MINIFRGEYNWLSNFYDCTVTYDGCEFKSVEHAYLYAKSPKDPDWLRYCLKETASIVKRKSKSIDIRGDWDDVKLDIMYDLLIQKFNQEPFKTKLIETGEQNIIEGNSWGDEYWGVNLSVQPNYGENHLGRIIMKIRKKIK